MPGIHGGQAVSEVLFGVVNPGGKLPVTMYHSSFVNETEFLNMSMSTGVGRSYRYYKGVPIYPFGYGLSYTEFVIVWEGLDNGYVGRLTTTTTATYNATVKNVGEVRGDEVVMAFFVPKKSTLKSFPQVLLLMMTVLLLLLVSLLLLLLVSLLLLLLLLSSLLLLLSLMSHVLVVVKDTPVPLKQLFGFQRVSLDPGASATVSFRLTPVRYLSLYVHIR